MFVLTPVSALHSYSYNPHYSYLAQQRAERRARAEARIRRHQQEQLILDALHAQEYHDYHNSPFYDYGYGPVCPPRSHCPALHYDAAIQQVRRQAAIEQAAREREARYQELKRLAAITAQREERRRAEAERFLNLFLDQRQAKTVSSHSLSNPLSGHSPQFQEIPAQPVASTSKALVQDEPPLKQRLQGHFTTEYESHMRDALQSLFSSLSGGNSSGAPAVSASANPSVSGQGNEEGLSQDKGKGKEFPQSDSEEEPSASPAQIDSSLSQIASIASRLEALISNFQFPAELDFSPERSPSPSYSALDTNDEFALTYTQTNAPLRAHEHALSLLLSELDNVSSFGSRVVKDARRAVVARVEEALEKLEEGVEERRGRARARNAGSVSVESVPAQNFESTPVNAEPVEQTSYPMDVDMDASPSEPESTDIMPVQVPIDEVPGMVSVSVDVPIMDASAEGSTKLPDLINPTVLTSSEISIEAPTSRVVTESNVASSALSMSDPASLLTAPSEGLAAQVSVPQDVSSPESEELLVNTVSMVSEEAPDEDMAVIEHYPAEVVNTTEMPVSYPPAANEEQNGSDAEAVKSPIPPSPLSEAEMNTFLLSASLPASPHLVPSNSDDEDGVVVNYEHENKDEDEWSDVE